MNNAIFLKKKEKQFGKFIGKWFKLGLFILIITALVTGLWSLLSLYSLNELTEASSSSFSAGYPEEFSLSFDQQLNLRQGVNQCGPMSVLCVNNVLNGHIGSVTDFEMSMRFRLPNNMTLPFGITDLLKQHGISSRHKLLVLWSDTQRIDYLRRTLASGKPIILLNKTDGIQHYFTLLGYNSAGFYLYDSYQDLDTSQQGRQTIDQNGSKPGNRYYTNEELLKLWSLGGKYFFRYYGIVAEK